MVKKPGDGAGSHACSLINNVGPSEWETDGQKGVDVKMIGKSTTGAGLILILETGPAESSV